MKIVQFASATIAIAAALSAGRVSVVDAAMDSSELATLCTEVYGDYFEAPNEEPLGPCQWWLSLVGASMGASYKKATGKGVKVGIIDGGLDFDHPDIAPNVDVDLSCSFIYTDTPTAGPEEIGDGDCSNKDAARDYDSHGTHVGAIVAAPINGVGIAGVAPEATIVSIKACVKSGFCFSDSVAAALRYAADIGMDIVNLSLYPDPYLYYCKNDKGQAQILKELQDAVRYAQKKGVLIVAAAGNEASDLQHPIDDAISPDWPPDTAVYREIKNNCRTVPAELPGVLTVSSTGPIGMPGYDQWIAYYSTVGMSRVDVAAPGGSRFRATGLAQDAIISAMSGDDNADDGYWLYLDGLEQEEKSYRGVTSIDQGSRYGFVQGTSMASPVAAGVAALVKEVHPNLSPGAIKALVQNGATKIGCPPNWEPEDEFDQREKCYGKAGRTSFFGHGLVNVNAAAA